MVICRFSPSAAYTRHRGKHSFACDNYVTPEIAAAVLILAVCTHLLALYDKLTKLATNLKGHYTSRLLYIHYLY